MGPKRPSAILIAITLFGALAFSLQFAARVGSGVLPNADFTLDVEAAQAGRVITYTILYDNVGTGSAQSLTIRDVLPAGATYLGEQTDLQGGVWTKQWTNVAPGSYAETVAIELPQTARDGDRVVNFVELEYATATEIVTKAYWHEMGVTLAPAQAPFPALVLAAPIAGGTALAAGIAVLRPRRRAQLEQVFLMHNSGMLIHHWAANTSPSRDIDILSGMFVILKEFVRDSFREKAGGLTELQFGDSRVFLAEGRHAILAAVVSGTRVNGLPMEIAAAVEDFEETYAPVLQGWTGRLDVLPEAKSVVERLVGGEYGRRRIAA